MSGGSMEYLYRQVEDANFQLSSPDRIAMKKYLIKVARALKAIEWNDSGDGDDEETKLIRKCIGDNSILASTIEEAEIVRDQLIEQIQLALSYRK